VAFTSASASRIRVASDIGGVILEGVADASTTAGEDYGETSVMLVDALDGLRALASEFDVFLLSYCGQNTEAKTRVRLRDLGVSDVVPETRWRFTRTRPEKAVVMKAEGIALLVDDRGDIVSTCHASYLRAVLFRNERDGGTGWRSMLADVRAALAAPIPDPRLALAEFNDMRRLRRGGAAGGASAAVKPQKAAPAQPVAEPLRRFIRSVAFLGTGSGLPTRSRGASATVVCFADNAQWLFDCGEGTQIQFGRSGSAAKEVAEKLRGACVAEGVSLSRVSRIFITHLHGDHCFGLPGLLLTLAAQRGSQRGDDDADDAAAAGEGGAGGGGADADADALAFRPFNDDTECFEIVGPVGLAAFLRCALVSSDAGHLGFRYRVTELLGAHDAEPAYPPPCGSGGAPSATLHFSEAPPRALRPDGDGATTIAPGVAAARIDHRVTCYGFSVTEADRPGALDAKRAVDLGVRGGKDMGALKAGADVTLADGRVVRSADVVLPPTRGRVFIHLGDCIENTAAARAARGAGPCPLVARATAAGRAVALVVHEATFCDALANDALEKGHSTARQAAAYAAEARAESLCLTHLSQRYLPRSHGPDAAAIVDALEAEARAELRDRGASACVVRAVEDFEAIIAVVRK
jgi:ribonuclease Z